MMNTRLRHSPLLPFTLLALGAIVLIGSDTRLSCVAVSTGQEIRVGKTQPFKSLDAARLSLVPGAELMLGGGQTFELGPTIRAADGVHVDRLGGGADPVVRVRGNGKDAILIPAGVRGVSVRNVTFDVADKGKAAIAVSGEGAASNITQLGAGRVLNFDGTEGFRADGVYHTNGLVDDYGVYFTVNATRPGGPRWNENVTLTRVDMRMLNGPTRLGRQHLVRGYGMRNVTIGAPDKLFEGGPGRGYSVYLFHSGWYDGCALNLKSGDGVVVQNALTFGPIGLGDNRLPSTIGNPGWESQRLNNLTIRNCELNVGRAAERLAGGGWSKPNPAYVRIGSGVTNLTVQDTTIRAIGPAYDNAYDTRRIKGACLAVDGAWPDAQTLRDLKRDPLLAGAWPAPNGRFVRCTFIGEQLCATSSAQHLGRFEFLDCVFIDATGRRFSIGAGGALTPLESNAATTVPATPPATSRRAA